MHKSVGGVEYDARAALYPGADYPKSREQNGVSGKFRAELLLVDAQELEEEDNARRLEALGSGRPHQTLAFTGAGGG